MFTYLSYVLAALYLGIVTSISPCPLATNIAAISYIGRKVERPRLVMYSGLLYTVGRCVLYLALAGILTTTALSIASALDRVATTETAFAAAGAGSADASSVAATVVSAGSSRPESDNNASR